jgi:prepilin-type N-terminal cleavage/methylation domain-containing protein
MVKRHRESGLTLVELMVTLTIASLVTAGTFAFFAGQQRMYDVQTRLLNVQQNLWASMDTIGRYVRLSGKGMLGCVRADSDAAGPDTGDPAPVGSTAPLTGLRAFRNGSGAIRIPPLWIQNGAAGAPDTLTVAFGTNASGNMTDATLGADVLQDRPTAAITTPAGQTLRFLRNEFILLIHTGQANGDRGCSLFQVTDINSGANTLLHASSSVWNTGADIAGLVPFTYPGPGATSNGAIRSFGQLTWVQFAIDTTGAPDVPPRLTMNRLDGTRGPEVLADGIEDMQIAFACDAPVAGVADGALTEGTDAASRRTDEWTFNESGDAAPICNRPDAVRVTLVARSLTPDTLLSQTPGNAKPAAEDGAAGATDSFRHRASTLVLYPRN